MTATNLALYRAKRKRFLDIDYLAELGEDRFRKYRFSLRGEIADIDQPHFEEPILFFSNETIAIYSTPRQLSLLKVGKR